MNFVRFPVPVEPHRRISPVFPENSHRVIRPHSNQNTGSLVETCHSYEVQGQQQGCVQPWGLSTWNVFRTDLGDQRG